MLDLNIAAPAIAAPIETTTETVTETPHTDAVETIETVNKKQDEMSVSLWAKTNKANRELAAKVKEYEAKTKELESKLVVTPDEAKAREDAIKEVLAKPGAAKRLLDAGKTFDQIVAELTDIEVADPKYDDAAKRLAKIESDLAAREQADKDQKTKSDQAKLTEYEQTANAEVSKFAKSNDEVIHDDRDARNGTPRWAIVSERPDLIAEARSEAAKYVQSKHPQGVTDEQAKSLVSQALDQLELIERGKLAPILKKIAPTRPMTRTPDKSSSQRITADSDPFGSSKPKTITSSMKGPAPTGSKPTRYSGGPRQITYSD